MPLDGWPIEPPESPLELCGGGDWESKLMAPGEGDHSTCSPSQRGFFGCEGYSEGPEGETGGSLLTMIPRGDTGERGTPEGDSPIKGEPPT